jgi:hypothetical protein
MVDETHEKSNEIRRRGRIIIDLPPEAAREMNELIQQSGNSPTDLFRKALGLYELSKEAVREGKAVGIAETADCLETEFVGI